MVLVVTTAGIDLGSPSLCDADCSLIGPTVKDRTKGSKDPFELQ